MSTVDRLLVRRARAEIVGIDADIADLRQQAQTVVASFNANIADIRQQLQVARNTAQALVAEVSAARGGYPTIADRLAAIEASIVTPPPPTP